MRILICGLGALGSVYGCLLKNQGHYVAGLDRPEVIAAIRTSGLNISGIWGSHRAELDDVASQAGDLIEGDFDMAVVSVKAFQTAAALEGLGKGILQGKTLVMLAQNGLGNYECALQYVPADRLIVARVIFGSVTEAHGTARVTVIADDVLLGSPGGEIPDPVLETWAEIFRSSGIPTRVSDCIMDYIWAKVIYNSSLNPLGAILEHNYGKLGEISYSRNIMDNIVSEIFAVMKALGQSAPWPDAASYLRNFYAQVLPSTAGHHASMLQDIRSGRKTEIDALNGAISAYGKALGVPTPYNDTVYQILKAKEEDRLLTRGE